MLKYISNFLFTALFLLISNSSRAEINETIQLSFDSGRNFQIVSVNEDRLVIALSEFDMSSFTDLWRLYEVNNNYQLELLVEFPERLDSEVGIHFQVADNTATIVALEGVYQFDFDFNSIVKISEPDFSFSWDTLHALNYESYRRSFFISTHNQTYFYEYATFNEGAQETLAKIYRLQEGQFIEIPVHGYQSGKWTTLPYITDFGLVYQDEDYLYVLPDYGHLLQYSLVEIKNFNITNQFIAIETVNSEIIRLTFENGVENKSILADSNSNSKLIDTYDISATHSSIYAIENEDLTTSIVIFDKDNISAPILFDQSLDNLSRDYLSNIYVHSSNRHGFFITNQHDFNVFDYQTGSVMSVEFTFPVNRLSDLNIQEVGHLNVVFVVSDEQSQGWLIGNSLQIKDISSQIDFVAQQECIRFSYLDKYSDLNAQLNFRCPASAHYSIDESLTVIPMAAGSNLVDWNFNNSGNFIFNKLWHTVAIDNSQNYHLLSWHGENDFDLDGVSNNDDIFPENVTEYMDTDLDGIGNNDDSDDDNDGLEDNIDPNPLQPNIDSIDEQQNVTAGSLSIESIFLIYVLCFYRCFQKKFNFMRSYVT